MTGPSQSPEALARAYLDIWNERAYEEIPNLVHESFVMYDPTAPAEAVGGPKGEVHGRAGLEAFIRGVVRGFPDFHVSVLSMATDSGLVMYDGRLSLTNLGDFFGVPPTGRSVAVRYMGLVRVEDAAVIEHRVYPPMLEIAEQLGFTFPAVLLTLPRLAWGKLRQLLGRRG